MELINAANIALNDKGVWEAIRDFSMATDLRNVIVIDQYSKQHNTYIQSFKLYYKEMFAGDILNIITNNDTVILKFENNYASFKFSR